MIKREQIKIWTMIGMLLAVNACHSAINHTGSRTLLRQENTSQREEKSWSDVPLPQYGSVKPTLWKRDHTLWITQAEINAHKDFKLVKKTGDVYPYQRLSIGERDGKPVFVNKYDQWSPNATPRERTVPDCGRFTEHHWPFDYSCVRAIIVRHKFYSTNWPGNDNGGKLIKIDMGKGWIGDGFNPHDDGNDGDDGASVNLMRGHHRGDTSTTNRLSIFFSHEERPEPDQKFYGSSGKAIGDDPWPLNKEMTIDIVIYFQGEKKGYELYQDGRLIRTGLGRAPMKDPTKAKSLGIRFRGMHGGNEDSPEGFAIRNYREEFSDMEIWVISNF